MVLSFKDNVDGKNRYIKKFGSLVVLTKNPKGAEEEMPEGWEVVRLESGRLRLKKRN